MIDDKTLIDAYQSGHGDSHIAALRAVEKLVAAGFEQRIAALEEGRVFVDGSELEAAGWKKPIKYHLRRNDEFNPD